MVPIEDYESLFSDRILERAAGYCNDESIDMLAIHPKLIKARVYGTYPYTLEIKFEDDEITGMYCSCPYDYGHCKHLAAVLMYYLEYEGDFPDEVYERGEILQENKPPALKTMLENASREDLLHFIQTAIKQEPRLFDQAKLFFMPEGSQNIELLYEETIDREIQHIIEEGGYNGWQISSDISSYLDSLMESVYASGNFQHYVDLSLLVARKANELSEMVDDSSAHVYDTGSSVFWKMEEMIKDEDFTEKKRKYLFNKLIIFLEDEDVYKFDLGTDSWGILSKIVRTRDELAILENHIMEHEAEMQYSSPSEIGRITILDAMQNICSEEEIAAYAWQHRNISGIRQGLIEASLEAKNYEQAKNLAYEGLDAARKGDSQWEHEKWEETILEIAVHENNKADIREWAWHILKHHRFSIEKYRLLKANTPGRKRAEIVERLLSSDIRLTTHQKLQVFAEEKLHDEMLKLLEKEGGMFGEFSYLDEFSEYLLPKYKREVIGLYMKRIRIHSAKNMGRKHYQTTARYLMKLKEMGAAQQSKELAAELRKNYSRRPAMLQELSGL